MMTIIAWTCLASGGLLLVIGAIGMLRMPDIYTRMHAAGIIDTLGLILAMLGLALQTEDLATIIRLVFITLFVLITAPVAVHALCQAIGNQDNKNQPPN